MHVIGFPGVEQILDRERTEIVLLKMIIFVSQKTCFEKSTDGVCRLSPAIPDDQLHPYYHRLVICIDTISKRATLQCEPGDCDS